MSGGHNTETANKFKEALQTVSAALLLFTSISFVAGLLIVNIHLARFGVRSPTLNRAEYVLVGVIFVLLTAVSHFAIDATLDWIKLAVEAAKKKPRRAFVKLSFYAFSAIAIPAFALSVFSGFRLPFFDWHILVSIFMLGALARYARLAARHAASIWSQYLAGSPTSDEYHPFAHKFTALFEAAISVAVLIGFYATFTFPHIESAYGGGFPSTVRVIPTKHGAEVLSSLKISITAAGDSGPFFVVSESDSEIYVTSRLSEWKHGTVTRLKKSLFDAVVISDDDHTAPTKPADHPASPAVSPGGPPPKPNVPPVVSPQSPTAHAQ